MRRVPSLLFEYMKETLAGAGCDVEAALEGLSLAEVQPRFGLRVDWNELATFLNRATAGMSDEEAEALGERYVRANRYLGAVFGIVTRPTVWYRLLWLASRHAFPHIRFSVEKVDRTNLTLQMVLPESFEGCPFFFRGTIGEVRAMPRLLNLPDAQVSADVTAHSGVYRVCLGAPERSWEQLGQPDNVGELVEDLLGVTPPGLDSPPENASVVYTLQEHHGLTRAEARVAVRLAQGMPVADIAKDLGVSVETVRTHLKRSYGKLGVRRQAELVRAVLSLAMEDA